LKITQGGVTKWVRKTKKKRTGGEDRTTKKKLPKFWGSARGLDGKATEDGTGKKEVGGKGICEERGR